MPDIPGIVFGDSRRGSVARLGDTGLGVHEIVRTFRDVDGDRQRLQDAYHWLSDLQLRIALAYAEAYRKRSSSRSSSTTRDARDLWETYPFMRPEAR